MNFKRNARGSFVQVSVLNSIQISYSSLCCPPQAVPDSGYVDGMSVESTSVTPSLMTGTPISSPGGDYGYLNNRLMPRKPDDTESVRIKSKQKGYYVKGWKSRDPHFYLLNERS